LGNLTYLRLFVLFIVITPFINEARCQIIVNLTKEFEKAKDYKEAVLLYQQNLGDHTAFFSGTAYPINKAEINGHPFFHSDKWQTGDIYIYGQVFFDIEMKLDIYKDALILNQDSEHINQAIVINETSLKGAFFLNRFFINIQTEEADRLQIKEGYYELAYQDKSTILIKHRKTIVREVKFGTELIEEFVNNTKYYAICNGKASLINSKKALINALSKHNKEVKRFIKDNRIKYSKRKLEEIIKIVRFYDSQD
jgi:hypothetical protein